MSKEIVSKFVFMAVKAPDFKTTKKYMIIFTVAGSIWTSVIWHKLADC